MLPTKKTCQEYNLQNIRMLLYGPPKIGKTTFGSGFENALFLATEKGYKGLDIFVQDIEQWEDFLKSVDDILKGNHKFKTIIIDTIDNLFSMCQSYVSKKYRIEHPSDEKYGKGWDLLKTHFREPILKLVVSDYGLVFISHSLEEEIKTRHVTYNKTVPSMDRKARKIINPFMDIIGCCGFEDVKIGEKNNEYIEKRVIYFHPSEYMEAGDRTGFLPAKIPLSYKRFKKYFDGDSQGGENI